MPKIIAQAVEEGLNLYEARLLLTTLKEIYTAWLEGGRRKAVEPYGAESQDQEKGEFWEPGEELPGEDGAEFLQPDGQEACPGESDLGAETALEDLPEEDPGEEI